MSEKEPSVLGQPAQAEANAAAEAADVSDDADGDRQAQSTEDLPDLAADPGADLADSEADPGAALADSEADPGAASDLADDVAGPAASPAVTPGVTPGVTPAVTPAARAQRRRSAPTFYVAGFWRRIGAAALDMAVVVPVAVLLVFVVSKLAGLSLPPGRHRGIDFWLDLVLANDPAVMGSLGLALAISLVYVLVFQIVLGYTLGMRALKIRIIDVYGDRVSTGRSIARTAGYLGCLATLSLGFLWIGFDAEKRGLHDWVSGTYVVKM